MFQCIFRVDVIKSCRNVGFDWEEKSQVWDKVFEEFDELKNEIENMDPDNMENEFGVF